ETEPLEDVIDDEIVDGGSQEGLDSLPAQCHCYGFAWPRIDIDHISVDGSTGQFLNHRRRPIAGEAGHLDIGSSLESVRSFAEQAKYSRCLPDRQRIEVCTFEENVLGRGGDFRFGSV